MKTRLVVLASILIVIVACGQTAAAAGKTYYVSTSGDDSADGLAEKTAWRTIAHAAKVATAGDTVKIKAGKYDDEHVVIENSGTRKTPIVFEGYGGMPVLDGKDRTGKGITVKSGKYVELKNIKVTQYKWGVFLTHAEYVILDNIVATNLGGRGYSGWGIYLGSSHHCVLRNCSVTDARAVNIQVWHSNYNVIENCTSYGIETGNAVDYYIAVGYSHDNIIRNCLTQNKHPLVKVHAGHGIILKYKNYNNKVINCVARGHGEAIGAAHFSHDNEFRDCTVYDDGEHKVHGWGGGLFARDGSYRNRFVNCRTVGVKNGILIYDTVEEIPKQKNPPPAIQKDNVFENCVIGARNIGIFLRNTHRKGSGSNNNRIRNCIITGPKTLIYAAGAESGNTITNSIITGIPSEGSSNKFRFSYCNFWKNGFKTPSGAGNMSKNPLFVNAGKGDFRLKPDSPCRSAGEYSIDMGVLEPWSRPIWVVHAGGDWDGPENTIAALKKSVALGARYAEIDLRVTKDGQVVVIHDETLDRTTNGKGRVKELTYAQIKQYDAGSWFRPKFKNERVPLLSDVLDFARVYRMRLLLHVKEPEVCPLLFGLLKKHGMVDDARVYMMAANAAVRKALDPRIKQYPGSLVQPWGYKKGPKIVLDALKNKKKGGALMRSYTCVLEAQKIKGSGSMAKIRTSKYSDEHADDDGKRYPEVGEEITRFTWAKKELLIEKGPLAEAELRFNIYEYKGNTSPLFVEINGKVSKVPAGKTQGKFKWLTVKVPASALRMGRNDIIFKSNSTAFNSWVLGISTRCHYNRSAKAYMNGAVWDYHRLGHDCSVNGEYMVRLALKRPAQKHVKKPSPLKPFPKHPAGAITGPEYKLNLKAEIRKKPRVFAGGAEVPFNLSFSTEQKFDRATRDKEIDIHSRGGEVILADWVNVLDEAGNISLIENTNKKLPEPPALADDKTWLRKELLVEDPDVFAAQVIFSTHQMHIRSRGTKKAVPLRKVPPLYIDVNGHTITFPSQVSWRRRSGMDWFVVDVPVKHLKKGINNIIFRSDKGSTWRIGLENSLIPNRSAQSTDGGKTWNYNALGIRGDHNGEFLIRLRLKRYAPAGSITSPVIDLAEETSSEKIKKQIIVKKLLLQWQADTPKGTDVVIRTRSGLTRLYNPATWTQWSEPYKPDQQFKSPKLRYIQWKATLVTRNPKQTPALKSVKISGSVITRPSQDEKKIKITKYQNETIVQSSWPFTYQRWDEPKLKVLREENNLDEVIKGARTEFEKYLLLRKWSSRPLRWKSHWCGADSGEDALNILEWCVKDRAHCGLKAHSFCHHYAHLYCQCCLAMGLQARMLVLTGDGAGHGTTEVWSNEFKKWMFMDATHDFHVAKDGKWRKKAAEGVVPLSILERHNRRQAFPLYKNLAIWLRNDILSIMPPNPLWDGGHHFRWDDRLWWLDKKIRFQPEFTKHSDRVADLYWTLNQTAFDLQYSDKPGSLLVNLETVTPNFDTFEIKLDGKPWRASPPAFTWKLRKGQNTIQVRTRNKFGNPGIVSQVVLTYGGR